MSDTVDTFIDTLWLEEGLSRNTLYYYVSDRADLVFRCFERACESFTDDLVAAEDASSKPSDVITDFVERQLDFDRPPQAVLTDVEFLPPPQQAVIREQHGDIPMVLLHLAGLYDGRTAVPTLAEQIARFSCRA